MNFDLPSPSQLTAGYPTWWFEKVAPALNVAIFGIFLLDFWGVPSPKRTDYRLKTPKMAVISFQVHIV